jgi:[ribosomal protein S18]-alanine N-acetyltransferase
VKMPLGLGRRDYAIERAGTADIPAVAAIHAEEFYPSWSEEEFDAMVAESNITTFVARQVGRPGLLPAGFVMIRQAADEAEILTVATALAHRRKGVGWALMDAALREMHASRIAAMFLEVDETNQGAIALYRRLGFFQVGGRPGYYRTPDGQRRGALVMRRDLR